MVSVRITFQLPTGDRAAVVLTAPDFDAAVRDARRELIQAGHVVMGSEPWVEVLACAHVH